MGQNEKINSGDGIEKNGGYLLFSKTECEGFKMILSKRINSRNKGATYERKIAKAFGKVFGELRRTPLSGGMEWKGDIQSIDGKMPFHIECKKQEKLNIWKALKQAEDDCPDDKTPIVVFARNRSKDYVVIGMDEFLSPDFVEKLKGS